MDLVMNIITYIQTSGAIIMQFSQYIFDSIDTVTEHTLIHILFLFFKIEKYELAFKIN